MPNVTIPLKKGDPVNGRRRVITTCKHGRTKQEFKEESEINFILDQWMNGNPPQLKAAEYGDYTTATDFQESMEKITYTQQQFATLPSKVRERFGNSPEQMLKFLENNDNLEEAAKLGLIHLPDPPAKEPEKAEATIVPTNTPAGGKTTPD
nr:MAG: internal scaffolding protein [Microvirus sp.]